MATDTTATRTPEVPRRWKWPSVFGRIPYDRLSVFCGNMATCLSAGLRLPDSLRASVRHGPDPVTKRIAENAAEQAAAGTSLYDALEPNAEQFPPFFLPVLRCGELSGRLDETFAYLGKHCGLLVRPGRLARNLWLYPLVVMVTGSIIKIAMVAAFLPWRDSLAYARSTLADYLIAAVVVAIALVAPQTKAILDWVQLSLPVVRETQCDLAVNRFFQAMNLVYCTGGMRVEAMIRMAARSVDNHVLRDDFLQAAAIVESRGTIADAFAAPRNVAEEYKELVHTGDQAGKLEHAFATICRIAEAALEHRLDWFNRIFLRLVSLVVVLSVAMTAVAIAMTLGAQR